ncbi:hypothetical protein [Rufibacter roseolus]|uniref:hypothetical protein n=1 Tax=Rufibacter roseolus TaxID=2817375 RepID=UPI001B30C43C|nr:hypothetical protein [Rufibacter roseolus]
MEFQNPYFDGIPSIIIIGLILISISVLLARESRSLLMGESADAENLQAIVALVKADEATWKVDKPMSMYMAPE